MSLYRKFLALAGVLLPLTFSVKILAAVAPPRLSDLGQQLIRFVDVIYAFGGIIFLVLLLFFGVQYMISQGDSDKLEEIKKRFTYWIVGFVLFFFSSVIVSFVYSTTNVKDCNGKDVYPGFSLFMENPC